MMAAAISTPWTSVRVSSIVIGLFVIDEMVICGLGETLAREGISPRMEMDGGRVSRGLRKRDHDRISGELFDELGRDPLHGSILVGGSFAHLKRLRWNFEPRSIGMISWYGVPSMTTPAPRIGRRTRFRP
jgi:hypothetical protein